MRSSKATVGLFDPDNDMISATIFYNKGTIASTSQGKIIHILNKMTTFNK